MKTGFLLSICIGCAIFSFGQYTAQGTIEFQRKINMHRQLDDMASESGGSWFEQMKTRIPKFSVSYFDYSFNLSQSLYKPGREVESQPKMMFGNAPASSNTVYTDFKNHRVTAAKQVFEEKFLVEDSLRKIDWKIMDEVRTIAHFKCRKAVGIICDSVYVVAFYSEDIMVNGGPEMFAGLPGMILEVAIPRLYTTWIATKIDIAPPKAAEMKAPDKGEKVSQKELHENLMASISKWGAWAQRSIWWSVL